jgi:hypothetical protein
MALSPLPLVTFSMVLAHWLTFIALSSYTSDSEVEQTFESLVGSLKAAKKRGILNFEGQMLLMY